MPGDEGRGEGEPGGNKVRGKKDRPWKLTFLGFTRPMNMAERIKGLNAHPGGWMG